MSAKEANSPTTETNTKAIGSETAANASYANVVQNIETKNTVATTSAVKVTITAEHENKENNPTMLKTIKSWSEEAAEASAEAFAPIAVAGIVATTILAGEKRAAVGGDTTAENSSEIDDNADFVPVISHHRRDRKKARKENIRERLEKPTATNTGSPRAGASNSNSLKNNTRASHVSGTGEKEVGSGTEKSGRSRRRGNNNKNPAKNVGGAKAQKDRKDNSPSSNVGSANEIKTSNEGGEQQIAPAANANQPKKFVAAPPPKVNAWKS